jgi:aminoglycoside phosphotransferase (APT) family kinase protein
MAAGYHRALDDGQLRMLLATAGLPGDGATARPVGGGTYNSVYRVRCADGTRVVVKLAPGREAPILRYESRIVQTEARFYDLAARADGVPVPRVLRCEVDSDLAGGGYLVLTELPGDPWHGLRPPLDGPTRAALRTELGRHVAVLHSISGPGFGYPAGSLGPLRPTWRTAFLEMVDAVLADAERFEVVLPRPAAEVRELFETQAPVLDVVSRPALVHFDLWDGNILVDRERARIGGLIDAERAFWGDPLADFVSLALFGDLERDEAFLTGYRAAGGDARFDAGARLRLHLYRGYLYLIMLVEAVPRGFDEPHRAWLSRQVHRPLAATLRAWARVGAVAR